MSEVFELRRLNDEGLLEATTALLDIDSGSDPDIASLVQSDALTDRVPGIDVRRKEFTDRMEAGRYFSDLLAPLRSNGENLMADKGLWTWLALLWIDHLAPKQVDGSRRLFDHRRWILSVEGHFAYYRHCLAGPYYVFEAHRDDPDRAAALLCGPVEVPGEVWEQIASRQDFVGSPSLMKLVRMLYFDESSRRLKRGAASQGPGGVRRLPMVMNQFGLTWDVAGMPVDRLLALLPSEFDRFR